MFFRIGFEVRRIDDGELRRLRDRGGGIVDEQIAAEEIVPGVFRDDAHGKPVRRVGAGVAIEDVQLLVAERLEEVVVQRVPMALLDRPIDFAPRDLRLARRLTNHKLVVRGPTRVLTGPAHDRPLGRDRPFLLSHGLLVERRRRQVPLHPIRAYPFAVELVATLHCHQKAPKV